MLGALIRTCDKTADNRTARDLKNRIDRGISSIETKTQGVHESILPGHHNHGTAP